MVRLRTLLYFQLFLRKFLCFADLADAVYQHCDRCNMQVPRRLFAQHQRTNDHKAKSCSQLLKNVQRITSAFKNRISSYRIKSDGIHLQLSDFCEEIGTTCRELIQEQLAEHISIKVNLELFAVFVQDVKQIHAIKSFQTPYAVVTQSTDFDEFYSESGNKLEQLLQEFLTRDSGKPS